MSYISYFCFTLRTSEALLISYFSTLHFNFSSTDNKLSKDKRLNTDVWYEEKTLNWVKASFEKKGKWEYKLVSIE